jgi:hypothetical protein
MMVSCIGTVTAFFVVNAVYLLPAYTFVAWVTPTVVGIPLIVYWRRAYRTGKPLAATG